MNRWYVYEFLKQRYMATGIVPTRDEVRHHFPGIDPVELNEGMAEFEAVIKWGA